jgi:hypothetical protein
MASDAKLPIAIFAALVALIAIPFLADYVRERRRPLLLEARVVTAASSDPIFRDGRRRVSAGETAEAALALRIGRRGSAGRWIAPVGRLALDGSEIDHQETEYWPEAGRRVRVFWFSVESSNLGGSLSAENAAERLRYRTYLAPEMGRGLRADRLPETHNDDHIGRQSTTAPGEAGTIRLYARVEVVESDSDVRPLQAVHRSRVPKVIHRSRLGAVRGFISDVRGGRRDGRTEIRRRRTFKPRRAVNHERKSPATGPPAGLAERRSRRRSAGRRRPLVGAPRR